MLANRATVSVSFLMAAKSSALWHWVNPFTVRLHIPELSPRWPSLVLPLWVSRVPRRVRRAQPVRQPVQRRVLPGRLDTRLPEHRLPRMARLHRRTPVVGTTLMAATSSKPKNLSSLWTLLPLWDWVTEVPRGARRGLRPCIRCLLG